jgi:hypothetical protein
MSINEKLKDRIKQEPKAFYVEEWDETIYCTPISCGEMGKLQKRHPDFISNMTGEAMVDLLMAKCLNDQGEKLFTLDEKPLLLRESMAVISTVVGAVLGSQIDGGVEKN